VTPARAEDKKFWLVNALVSAAALGLLFWLLVLRHPAQGQGQAALDFLPPINAGLNATAAVLLFFGWRAIKRGDRALHAQLMVSAFAASSLFLVSYLAYHFFHGDTRFWGTGALKAVYLAVLASHVLLSMAVVPLALGALWFAWRKRFEVHTRITRALLPIWIYVSVTGVAVYWMLYRLR
jgi:putative membrane protein